ncbi:MAG: hypothetical protein ACFFD2_18420, partial [Promethearchaeota archaeon]
MELFLRRAKRPFGEKIGEDKIQSIFKSIKNALINIPRDYKGELSSAIPKFLFKYSQGLDEISSEIVENILHHVLIFIKSLTDLADYDRNQVNQMIIKRSKSQMRDLLDILKGLVDKAKTGNRMNGPESFENILVYMLGESIKYTKFDDIKLFIKRAEDNFRQKIGENKVNFYIETISKALNEIDKEFKSYMNSEIAKFLFKFSQGFNDLSPETLENILNHVIIFTQSISDLGGKNKTQINQVIIKRSKNSMRGLFDLFKGFLEKVKKGYLMESSCNFDDIITYTLGSEEKHTQFEDIGGFLKRAEKKYAEYIGESKAQMLVNTLLKTISEIPDVYRNYLGSDISKYLFKYSTTLSDLSPETLENILNHVIIFTQSISDLDGKNKTQINQVIIKRSKNSMRGLFDL